MFVVRAFATALGLLLTTLLLVIQALKWIVGVGGDIDFLLARSQDPGWTRDVAMALLNPPPLAVICTSITGLGLIWWSSWSSQRSFRRKLKSAIETGLVSNPERVTGSPLYLRLRSMIHPEKGRLSPLGRVEEGRLEFDKLCDRAIANDDYEAYLVANHAAEWLEQNGRFFFATSTGYQAIAAHLDQRMNELHQRFSTRSLFSNRP